MTQPSERPEKPTKPGIYFATPKHGDQRERVAVRVWSHHPSRPLRAETFDNIPASLSNYTDYALAIDPLEPTK